MAMRAIRAVRGIRKPGIRTLVGAAAVAVVVSACGPRIAEGPATCAAPSGPPDGVSAAVFDRLNADRAAHGLGALRWNRQLYCLAQEWSGVMGSEGRLRHRDLNATIRSPGYGVYRTLGENILRGAAGMTGDQMEAAWMASPGHRANILSRSFTSIGIGLAYTADGRVYATQNFGG